MSDKVTEHTSNIFIKRIFGFSMASWVNCLISLISTPITTALFVPAELGKVNLFLSYINILIPFAYMGFDQAYVRYYNEPCKGNTSKSLFKLCTVTSLLLSSIVIFFVLIFGNTLSNNIIGHYSFSIIVSISVYLLSSVMLRYTNLKARMENNIVDYFIQSVVITIITKLSFVVIAINNPEGEIAIVFRALLICVCACVFGVRAIISSRGSQICNIKDSLFELSKYAIPLFPTVFLVMLNTSMAQIFLEKYVDYTSIGIYSNAVTISGIISILQSGLNTFWTPFVYEYHTQNNKIQKMHHIISFLLIFLALGMIGGKDIIYLILVDKQYWASKLIMPLLLVSPVCDTISETMGLGIELSKKTYLKFPVYCVNILVNLGTCLVLIPRMGVIGAAISNALASLSMLIVKSVIGEKYYKCSDNYFRLIVGMVSFLIIAVLNIVIDSLFIRLIIVLIAIIILCVVYYETTKYLVSIAKRMLSEKLQKRSK